MQTSEKENPDESYLDCDVLLVGAGIMSATLALLLKELNSHYRIEIVERLDRVAGESTDAKNNAGTGHSALCELNYTSEKPDGSMDIQKALKVMECFEVSKQLWASLVKRGALGPPESFIRSVPHMSMVTGAKDVAYLRKRHQALSSSHLFQGMEFSESPEQLAEWMPLVMANREDNEPIAATRSMLGTDVNFGELTRGIFAHLKRFHRVEPWLGHHVEHLVRVEDGRWIITCNDSALKVTRKLRAKFVFLGAGGGALELLNDSEIEEGEGYGGFPVSGQWLVCKNEAVIAQHDAKVYGKAKVGTPPMSVPHLDTRYIDGKKQLLFGPFAGFSTRFLKAGSYLDLALSVTPDNILPLLSAGIHNLALTRYLLSEVSKSFEARIDALREFLPNAVAEDWELSVAGQRVQIIKREADGGGKLEFGTEIISARDNTLAALLGASPGASTSVSIALEILADCFPLQMASEAWQRKLCEWIPSFGCHLAEDEALTRDVRAWSHGALELKG